MSYISPIEIISREMQTRFEDNVFKAVIEQGVIVDKDELIKALKYDRDQYEKGYTDGEHGAAVVIFETLHKILRDYLECSISTTDMCYKIHKLEVEFFEGFRE